MCGRGPKRSNHAHSRAGRLDNGGRRIYAGRLLIAEEGGSFLRDGQDMKIEGSAKKRERAAEGWTFEVAQEEY